MKNEVGSCDCQGERGRARTLREFKNLSSYCSLTKGGVGKTFHSVFNFRALVTHRGDSSFLSWNLNSTKKLEHQIVLDVFLFLHRSNLKAPSASILLPLT